MKKLILSVAIILGSFSTQAATVNSIKLIEKSVDFQDEYKEVDAVPATIKTALDNAYPGVKLDKAYVNDKNEYKIDIIVRGEKSTVYTDAQGNILKK